MVESVLFQIQYVHKWGQSCQYTHGIKYVSQKDICIIFFIWRKSFNDSILQLILREEGGRITKMGNRNLGSKLFYLEDRKNKLNQSQMGALVLKGKHCIFIPAASPNASSLQTCNSQPQICMQPFMSFVVCLHVKITSPALFILQLFIRPQLLRTCSLQCGIKFQTWICTIHNSICELQRNAAQNN